MLGGGAGMERGPEPRMWAVLGVVGKESGAHIARVAASRVAPPGCGVGEGGGSPGPPGSPGRVVPPADSAVSAAEPWAYATI